MKLMNYLYQNTKYSKFIVRSISSFLLLPFLFLVWKGGILFYLILIPIFIGMVYEILNMEDSSRKYNNIKLSFKFFIIVFLIFPQLLLIFFPYMTIFKILGFLITTSFIIFLFRYNLLLIILLCGISFSCASSILLSQIHPHLLLYILIIIFVSDISAYCFGNLVGGPKLLPKISPNKTISGSFFGIIASIIAACFLSIGGVLIENFFIGLIISIFSQVGDLLESSYKRQTGFKDSSNIIPGHGGILDRLDGLIISLPIILIFFKTNFIKISPF